MTISSSLNAGVTGLNANATRLAAISDNISNSATAGYKRVQTSFHSMVLGDTGAGRYAAGGVRASTMRLIDEGGTLISSNNPTDLAIKGRGFLPVTTEAAVANGGPLPMYMMTTGSFRPDTTGILRNEMGMVLMGVPLGSDGSIPTFPRDTSGGLRPIQVLTTQSDHEPTSRISLTVNLPSTGTVAGASGDEQDMSVEYYTNLGSSERLSVRFTPVVPAAGDPATNTWDIEIRDPGAGDVVVGAHRIVFSGASADGGRILSVTSTPPFDTAPAAYDPATGAIGVNVMRGADAQAMSIQIGMPGEPGGTTQLGDRFRPVEISKDGAPVGSLAGIEIDSQGILNAVYSTGVIRKLAMIPVVDVPNPNGLSAMAGQVYSATQESGAFFLWNAGDGPVGTIEGFAREESTTDVAHELTQMIQTQRAYSSNAKVIQTVDEMLQETTNIKR
ncbi:flagellar hook-basal body complex protein [Pararhodobacter sp. SW119]|uniref:flagellar hook protein FlgE n=1 Tax=Pararhodobacter sp. SW119 TaxID=2780075 RepID=UPI001AE0BB38|nr:flagellar hook-basal body complex protein [Pararhodobacter sp. SW119]